MTDSSKDIADKLRADVAADQARDAEELELANELDPPAAAPAPAPAKPPAPPAPDTGIPSPDPKSPPQDPPSAPPSAPAPPAAPPAAPTPAEPPAAAGELATMEDALGVHTGMTLTAAAVAVMQIFAPGSGGGLSAAMGETGAQDDIGLYTGDTMRMIASGLDPNAVASVYSTADNSAAWPIHITDKTTGDMPAKPWLNAKQSFQGDASNLVGDAQPNPNNLRPDLAHEPHFIAGAAQLAMRRGDLQRFARYLVEAKAWVAWNFFSDPSQTRGPTGGEGIFMPEASINQPRGAAWGPAALYQLYLVMCDAKALGMAFVDDGWFAWCKRAVEANIDFIEREYHLGTYDRSYAVPYYTFPMGWAKNPDGIMQMPMDVLSNGSIGYGKGVDGKTVVIGAFMQAFQSWVALWLVRISPRLTLSDTARAQLTSLRPWLARWPTAMFGDTSDATAWPWQYAGMYVITVGTWNADGSIAWAQNGGERFALPGNRPRPTGTAFLNDYNLGDVSAPVAMDGFGYGYVANIHPAHVEATNQGAEGTTASWARLTASDQWKAAQDFGPPFATMLDGLMFPGAAVPVTTAPAAPAPVATSPAEPPATTPAPPAATPAPVASGALQSFVGPPLTYFGVPQTNAPKDAVPAMYQGISDETRPFDIWGGAAWLKELRAFLLRADGHEITNFQCTLQARFAEDYSSVTWRCTNAPRQAYNETDIVGGFMPDGTEEGDHPYLGLSALSTADGGPALLNAFIAGSAFPNMIVKLDVEADEGGYSFFADVTADNPIKFEQWANGPSFSAGTYPISCMWEGHGLFVAQEGPATDGDILVKFDGTRELHPSLTGNYRNGFHLIDVPNQHRVGFSGGKTSQGAAFSVIIEELTGPNAGTVHTVPIIGDTIGLPDGAGGQWFQPDRCALDHAVEYDRFVGYFEDSPDGVAKLMEFTPGANRLTDPWTLKLQNVTRKTGDTVASDAPPKAVNSLWSKGKWIGRLDSYVIAPSSAGLVGIRPSFATVT